MPLTEAQNAYLTYVLPVMRGQTVKKKKIFIKFIEMKKKEKRRKKAYLTIENRTKATKPNWTNGYYVEVLIY